MGRLIFFLEEHSMKEFLAGYLPRLVPGWECGRDFLLIEHEGKSDLRKSVGNKLKAWRHPQDGFVIVQDNDGRADCRAAKQELLELCRASGRRAVLVRIVCQELESWYLGDTDALLEAFSGNITAGSKLRKWHRQPDNAPKPSGILEASIPQFGKGAAARLMRSRLDYARNTSTSFRVFAEGVLRLATSTMKAKKTKAT
jgi:hypothetical protein